MLNENDNPSLINETAASDDADVNDDDDENDSQNVSKNDWKNRSSPNMKKQPENASNSNSKQKSTGWCAWFSKCWPFSLCFEDKNKIK